jgi:hypothetical protein
MCGFSHKPPNPGRKFAAHAGGETSDDPENINENNRKKLQLGVLAPLPRN